MAFTSALDALNVFAEVIDLSFWSCFILVQKESLLIVLRYVLCLYAFMSELSAGHPDATFLEALAALHPRGISRKALCSRAGGTSSAPGATTTPPRGDGKGNEIAVLEGMGS